MGDVFENSLYLLLCIALNALRHVLELNLMTGIVLLFYSFDHLLALLSVRKNFTPLKYL